MRRLVAEDQPEHPLRLLGRTVEPLIAEHEVVTIALAAGKGPRLRQLAQEIVHLPHRPARACATCCLRWSPSACRARCWRTVQLQPARAQPARIRGRELTGQRAQRHIVTGRLRVERSPLTPRCASAGAGGDPPTGAAAPGRSSAGSSGFLPELGRARIIAHDERGGGGRWRETFDARLQPIRRQMRGKNISASALWNGQSRRPLRSAAVLSRPAADPPAAGPAGGGRSVPPPPARSCPGRDRGRAAGCTGN